MSYNLKLLTGLYYNDFNNDFVNSELHYYEKDNSIKEIVDITNIVFPDVVLYDSIWKEIIPIITPPNAYGYRFRFIVSEKIKKETIGGKTCLVTLENPKYGYSELVRVEVRNKNTPDIKTDFICEFKATFDIQSDENCVKTYTPKSTYKLLVGEKIPITLLAKPENTYPSNNILVQEKLKNGFKTYMENNPYIDLIIPKPTEEMEPPKYIIAKKRDI